MLQRRARFLRFAQSLALVATTRVAGCGFGLGECWCSLDSGVVDAADASDANVRGGWIYTGHDFCTELERDHGCRRSFPVSGPLAPPELA